jgi:RND family efflux transporter MFP subunit
MNARHGVYLLAAVACGALVTALVVRPRGLRGQSGATAVAASAPLPRASAPPKSAPARYVGVVLSERTVDVVARVDGLIADLPVKLGDRVHVGAVIARIEVPKLQHALATAKAAVQGSEVDIARADAEVGEATRQIEHRERLLAGGVGSQQDVEAARYQMKLARLRVAEARAKLAERRGRVEELERDREATTLRAPLAGVVGARYVDPGTSIAVLGRVVRIVGDGKPVVRFAMPQADVGEVTVGTEVLATGTASRARIRARVEAVSPEVDPAANMLFLEAQIHGGDTAGPWRSGELVHVTTGGGG